MFPDFWFQARALLGPPNVDWCEAPLRSLVEEPANTFSNLAYLIVAGLLFRQARPNPRLKQLAGVVFWMGLFSLIYHASNNALTQVLDFLGMFLYVGLLLSYNARRLGTLDEGSFRRHLLLAVAANLLLLFCLRSLLIPIQMIIGANSLVIFGSEWVLYRRAGESQSGTDYGPYLIGMTLMALASLCSALDLKRIWCDPHDHVFQGHAAWHVLSAGSIYFVARFYGQFSSIEEVV